MSWVAPIQLTDVTLPEGDPKRVRKQYLARVHEKFHKHAYTCAFAPHLATKFLTKEEAEGAQLLAKSHVEALPQAPEWTDFRWPTIELLPVEEVA